MGASLAEELSERKHDVVIVEEDPEVCHKLTNLNALVIHGNGVDLKTLEEAGLEKADIVIALTPRDEANLMACLVAKSTKKCKTVARVSNKEYEKVFEMLGIDIVIYPEIAAAKHLAELIQKNGK